MNPINFRSIISLLVLVALVAPPMAVAANKDEKKEKEVFVPAGIRHAAWDRLLQKYVDLQGLVNYSALSGPVALLPARSYWAR